MPTLALIRHGQSQWNLENRFTGWWDADLTEKGEAEARQAGELLREAGFSPRQAFSSVQTRAIRTLWLALTEMGFVLPQDANASAVVCLSVGIRPSQAGGSGAIVPKPSLCG